MADSTTRRLARVVRDRRALVVRMVVAELLARPGEGPLARPRPMRPRVRPVREEPEPR